MCSVECVECSYGSAAHLFYSSLSVAQVMRLTMAFCFNPPSRSVHLFTLLATISAAASVGVPQGHFLRAPLPTATAAAGRPLLGTNAKKPHNSGEN